eukprot:6490175-Prymnesium_polylepis.2
MRRLPVLTTLRAAHLAIWVAAAAAEDAAAGIVSPAFLAACAVTFGPQPAAVDGEVHECTPASAVIRTEIARLPRATATIRVYPQPLGPLLRARAGQAQRRNTGNSTHTARVRQQLQRVVLDRGRLAAQPRLAGVHGQLRATDFECGNRGGIGVRNECKAAATGRLLRYMPLSQGHVSGPRTASASEAHWCEQRIRPDLIRCYRVGSAIGHEEGLRIRREHHLGWKVVAAKECGRLCRCVLKRCLLEPARLHVELPNRDDRHQLVDDVGDGHIGVPNNVARAPNTRVGAPERAELAGLVIKVVVAELVEARIHNERESTPVQPDAVRIALIIEARCWEGGRSSGRIGDGDELRKTSIRLDRQCGRIAVAVVGHEEPPRVARIVDFSEARATAATGHCAQLHERPRCVAVSFDTVCHDAPLHQAWLIVDHVDHRLERVRCDPLGSGA